MEQWNNGTYSKTKWIDTTQQMKMIFPVLQPIFFHRQKRWNKLNYAIRIHRKWFSSLSSEKLYRCSFCFNHQTDQFDFLFIPKWPYISSSKQLAWIEIFNIFLNRIFDMYQNISIHFTCQCYRMHISSRYSFIFHVLILYDWYVLW